jgi:hypothetical protein
MTGWAPDISQMTIIAVGVIQGIGRGFLFVPLSKATLSTLSSGQRTESAGLFSLSRNLGSSIGISVANSLLTQNAQVNHADLAQHVTAVNRIFAGERRICLMVRLPSPEKEGTRRHMRERATLITERVRRVNRIKSLLASRCRPD